MATSNLDPKYSSFSTLAVSRSEKNDGIFHVEINRPKKGNSMNRAFWKEIADLFGLLGSDPDVRCIVFSGRGNVFSAGLDIADNADMFSSQNADVGRKALGLLHHVEAYQNSFSAIEKCNRPVIAVIHSACVGGAIDLITACDIRYCTEDAWFSVREVAVGLAADVGTLQRLPKITGNESLTRELCFTGRKLKAEEAHRYGLVSLVAKTKEDALAAAFNTAEEIASHSPVAVVGTKVNLIYSRDHSVAEGLDHVRLWNASMLQSQDLLTAMQAAFQKQKPVYSKL